MYGRREQSIVFWCIVLTLLILALCLSSARNHKTTKFISSDRQTVIGETQVSLPSDRIVPLISVVSQTTDIKKLGDSRDQNPRKPRLCRSSN